MPTYLVQANMYILLVIVKQGDVLCTVRTILNCILFIGGGEAGVFAG